MADDCRICFNVAAKLSGKRGWAKSMSLEEIDKAKAITRFFKCPTCGNVMRFVYLVKPK